MEENKRDNAIATGQDNAASTAVKEKPRKAPSSNKPRQLPPYKVLLHNDDVNDERHVVLSILKITKFSLAEAEGKMREAHNTGISLILVTHKERAELYQEQFRTFDLTVTIEPDA
ncbi:MAG: ATP-dependent Clp protease adaptor ClpS [Phycisphaerales bacterium]|nr:ATP-dependent Clp protease adaptor ClpS [Phycisphaerales bacterium]